MHGMDNLFSRLKQVDRHSGAKAETLQKLQMSRSRKRSPLLPSVVTGIVIVALLFFIMINVNKPDELQQAKGIAVEYIEKSTLLKSVSIDFTNELVDHLGVVEITNNPEWENRVTTVLKTMTETDNRPEGMSLYDLEVQSISQLYRFKIWQVHDEILIKDFDSGVYYINSGEDVEKLMEMANEFIVKVESPEESDDPIIGTEDTVETEEKVQDEVPTLGISKEQFKEKFNTDAIDTFNIRIGEIKESVNQNTVNYSLYLTWDRDEVWETVQITAHNNPQMNELTHLTFLEKNPGIKEPGHDRLHWYYMLLIVRNIFGLELSDDEIIKRSGFFDENRTENSGNSEEQFNLPEITIITKILDDEMSLNIVPEK